MAHPYLRLATARLLAVALLLASARGLAAQGNGDSLSRVGIQLSCPQSVGDTSTARAAPAGIIDGEVVPLSSFELRFTDSVPAAAEEAITFAASIWESYLASDVPVVIDVDWLDREDDRLLASAGPTTLFRDFPGAVPDTWYPVALAEGIVGQELNDGDDADIDIIVNAEVDWYFGTDLDVPRGQTDLVTVALHELGHGLGFISSADTIRGVELVIGFSGRFIVYDTYLEAGGELLTDTVAFDNPGELLLAAVTGAELGFAGPTVLDRNGGEPAPLFAPEDFDLGSSVSHFAEAEYPAGSPNALMTPQLARGEATHDPGPLAIALMADLGWEVNLALAPPPSQLVEAPAGQLAIAYRDGLLRPTEPLPSGTSVVVVDAGGRVVARSPRHSFAERGLAVDHLAPGIYVALVHGVGAARFLRP